MAFSTSPAAAAAAKLEVKDQAAPKILENLRFDNSFVRELPQDPNTRNELRQVYGSLFSLTSPTPPDGEPYLVAYSPEVCQLLDLDPSEAERAEFPMLMCGAAPIPGSQPYAQCYGGHQFGTWAGQLGDGRAITLGEILNSRGERWELQLKGAGQTPYSRRADGRAVMRSSIREFIASESMHHLGVPTTRALSLVGTGQSIARDMFYSGDVKLEPGAVVARVAPSFVRFGTFQLPVARGLADIGLVKVLADYLLEHHYTDAAGEPKPYLALLSEVVRRTALLVAQWQCIGFVHGVLNTDNMSVLGLTIDYGPYGFLDAFDPNFTPNLTDADRRRYSYRSQPEIVQWNLAQLANTLLAAELVTKVEAEDILGNYSLVLTDSYRARMARKLGLKSHDDELLNGFMRNMYEDDADFTNTFRALRSVPSRESLGGQELPSRLLQAIKSTGSLSPERAAAWAEWVSFYQARLRSQDLSDSDRIAFQDAANPKFIPRQHLLQYAIEDAERGDFGEVNRLMAILRKPYEEQPEADPKYCAPPPASMIRPGVCMLSCSS
ncbi:MAG: hypothetical protein WDW36_009226 [Sanguina aurantia]